MFCKKKKLRAETFIATGGGGGGGTQQNPLCPVVKLQSNDIKDKSFIVLSRRQSGKNCILSINELSHYKKREKTSAFRTGSM